MFVDTKQLPPALRGAFPHNTKRQARLVPTNTLELQGMYWDGGSRNVYVGVRLDTGQPFPVVGPATNPPQFGGPPAAPIVDIPAGVAVVKHSTYCGRDHGLTVYARHQDMAPLLPAPVPELPYEQRAALAVIRSLKSAYRRDEAFRIGFNDESWYAVKQALTAQGLLNKQGALTLAGRNAAADTGNAYSYKLGN